ncbi:hypothetical protein [Isoptericola sp. BMS4]|uniref:hypothetical protein n=1 Tax=Isoptericola sp. BMS4 TaxID=2527875 RepID=UPI00141EBBDE|nr:hypothetical protein [Isoptericola sp. BMS4]
MVTASLFVVLLVVVIAGLYVRKVSAGSLVLGALFGLALASTAVGPPILSGFQTALDSLVSAISSAVGGA